MARTMTGTWVASHFLFFKTRGLIDQYQRFWNSTGAFQPRNVLELGIWQGGSIVFWFESFEPAKHVAIDLSPPRESEQ